MSSSEPRITIGIPIFNGEKFIESKLNNILSQTFQNFEIVIYDNSNDSTPDICKKFASNDKRIHFFHESKRSGWIQGWLKVIKMAKHEFFVLASVDDLWSLNFLEENIRELDNNPSAVASIGILEYFGISNSIIDPNNLDNKTKNNFFKNLKQKFLTHSFQSSFEAKGSFEFKTTKILRNTWYRHHNGVIRTKELSKSILEKDMFLWDWPIVLNLVRYGDLHITSSSKYKIFAGESNSRRGHFELFKSQKMRPFEYILPPSTFTFWCIQNIGLVFFSKNFDYFFWLNFIHFSGILSDLFRKLIFRS